MNEFEELLCGTKNAVERFVRFRLTSAADADDVLQEVYLTAYRKFDTLREKDSFKAWIISIARSKCNDYFRQRSIAKVVSLDDLSECVLPKSLHGITATNAVRDTIDLLEGKDRLILHLFYNCRMTQADIAKKLGIPQGTVKSRLYTAKRNFKDIYPYPPKTTKAKGEIPMKKLPVNMPGYKIEKSEKKPFAVRWEELPGLFIVPKAGEKIRWGIYDFPSGTMSEQTLMEVSGSVVIHGIEGAEIRSASQNPDGEALEKHEHVYIAQLTDTHCRYLAEIYVKNGVRHYLTFLDGDEFIEQWGMGPNNRGKEVNIAPKGIIKRNGSDVVCDSPEALDAVGRYNITICGKVYDTVCVMNIEEYRTGAVATEQFIDKNGRTVLWRRFNRDDWAYNHYKQKWTEKLPENERIKINDETYVHWYDCITDYIL